MSIIEDMEREDRIRRICGSIGDETLIEKIASRQIYNGKRDAEIVTPILEVLVA